MVTTSKCYQLLAVDTIDYTLPYTIKNAVMHVSNTLGHNEGSTFSQKESD